MPRKNYEEVKKQKRETEISKIIDLAEQDLRDNKKKWYVDQIIDMDGHVGIVYQALEEMLCHGHLMYPNTYKYRKELSAYYRKYIREHHKLWERKAIA